MRKLVILLGGAAILALVNYSIYEKEQLLASGRVVFLELAPVDPRSIMQGDFMALRFALQSAVLPDDRLRDGQMVVALDNRSVARFRRLDNGTPLAPDEIRIFYRVRANQVRLGTNAFFFQEGDAPYYRGARYGEAHIGDDGQMILTGLRDGNLQKMGPLVARPSAANAP
jgi:uncharacterized membrane-anchored protein